MKTATNLTICLTVIAGMAIVAAVPPAQACADTGSYPYEDDKPVHMTTRPDNEAGLGVTVNANGDRFGAKVTFESCITVAQDAGDTLVAWVQDIVNDIHDRVSAPTNSRQHCLEDGSTDPEHLFPRSVAACLAAEQEPA